MSHDARADRNLLAGILALQMEFVTRDALIAAMNAWVLDKSRPLTALLREQNALAEDEGALLDALVAKHLEKHGHDPQRSLAAVSSIGSAREALRQIPDADVQASLAQVTADPPPGDPFATQATPPPTDSPSGVRYHVLRPHAKGGLGEVFVARDVELSREVALKTIRPHSADHPDSRARFLREAEITGGLEHPGIVPVYGLGSYADGRPYYAMRFIRGDSLQEAVARFHSTDGPALPESERNLQLRKLLGRFIDVCNAIAYAHSRGVLHRDLKPGNIMLGKYGETLVVDWGLARRLDESRSGGGETSEAPLPRTSGSGSTPTQMGEVIGTPAYMSPEQAAGRLDQLGPASDVYSLGATLYALLTGRSPLHDTEGGVPEVLRRVQAGTIPRPRQIAPHVPAALEAICLKALSLNPADRYPSPRALADDVEKWLADEPVSAHREPLTTRAARWLRKHRTLATSTAATLLVGLLGLTAGLIIVTGLNHRLTLANDRERAARAQAEKNFALAQEAVEKYLTAVTNDPELKRSNFFHLRKRLLETAVPFYKQFTKQRSTDLALEAKRGAAYGRLADIRREMGEHEAARAEYEQARQIQQRLAQDVPNAPEYLSDLARSHNNLGNLLCDLGKRTEARAEYEQARDLRQRLTQDFPDVPEYHRDLAGSHNNLGLLLHDLGEWEEARTEYEQARELHQRLTQDFPDVPEYRRDLAVSHSNLGNLLYALGKREEARAEYGQARDIQRQLVQDFPDVPEYRRDLAGSHNNLGLLLRDLGVYEAACAESRQARDLRQHLMQDFPAVPEYRHGLAASRINLGLLLHDLGERDAARAEYEQARDLGQRLVQDFSSVPGYRSTLATSHDNLGLLLRDLGEHDAARAECEQARDLGQRLVQDFPSVPKYAVSLGGTCCNLGNLERDDGKPEVALECYRRAIATLESVLQKEPRLATARLFLRNSYWGRAQVLEMLQRYPQAAKDWARAAELDTGAKRAWLQSKRAASLARASGN